MGSIREWAKAHLPYGVVCTIAHWINRPWLEDVYHTERLHEYTWTVAMLADCHPAGDPIADVGYAGSYFAGALTLFGPVTGVDPRQTPQIGKPQFRREWPWKPTEGSYGSVVCISALEHFLDPLGALHQMLYAIHEGGQVLLTVPVGATGHRFRGYRLWTLEEIVYEWPGRHESLTLFTRGTNREWTTLRLSASSIDISQRGVLGYVNRFLPSSTEHTVQAVAAVRLTRPSPLDALNPPFDELARPPSQPTI